MNDSAIPLAQALAAISVADQVRTPLGTFDFFDGVPLPASLSSLYDGLDFLRGVEVFLNAVPGASLVAMRRGLRGIGVDGPATIAITDPRANSGSFFLTPNTETTYGTMFLDLRDGPVVIEPPAESLCVVDDFWFRYVADMGIAGPDRGRGGKYLFLPPGYGGPEPQGFHTYRTPTFTNWVVFRALGGVEALRKTRVYRLADAADPPAMNFVDVADRAFNTVHANDFSFFTEIDELIQEEPPGSLDPERTGQLAAIGIRHGHRFAPDDRLRAILDSAAEAAAGISRALVYFPRERDAFVFDAGSWKEAFVGGSYEFLHEGARLLDARTRFHYFATVITPAMAHAQIGAGSAYAYTAQDAEGRILDGGKHYRLTLPTNPPAKNFWSVDIYDTQTRSLLRTDNPYPSLMSLTGTVAAEPDGSIMLWFGPTPPRGKQANWIQTVPGKSWFPILRLYGPLQVWFDKTWQPGELDEIG
ncbi:DUF1254 domain-containing protein [Nocardia mexicana]|uniref:DUF1254 domain-containing protein n=1 Tax=Nocardia mexicana TaxID=279262 RepID=A0A370GJ00_9NOCA|nr:DUF1254 domain-containing protein [Nocardia mexicana]RDI43641.1 hypothetical protein DFR68_11928 [Nocardia mexicana]